MERQKKYAFLDTDFIFKSHLSHDALQNTLADMIFGFEDFEFFCHEMILNELSRHHITPDPLPWLNNLIQTGRIRLYTDKDILNELKTIYGTGASSMYTTMLERSCNTFNQGFFDECYSTLKALSITISEDAFLDELRRCDGDIPHQNGIGEKKTYVLIQMMELLYPGRVYVFCSDDFAARQSLNSIPVAVRCLSIIGVFQLLKEKSIPKKTMKPYFDSLCEFLEGQQQTTYRVWYKYSRIRVPISQVFDEIYEDRFHLFKNGDLSYR